jgi:hypothetical protein
VFPEGEYLKGLAILKADLLDRRAATGKTGLTAKLMLPAGRGSGSAGVELGPLDAEEGLHVAHVGVLREQALHQRVVGRHVGGLHHQHEVRPRRHAPALLHRGIVHGALLEGLQMFGALPIQRDLDDGAQAPHPAPGRQQRHPALDDAGVHQPAHPAQRGGRRGVRALRPASWLDSDASSCSRSSRRRSVASRSIM